MSTTINPIIGSDRPIETNRAGGAEAERATVRMLAQQFESLLLSQMLQEMRTSMDDGDEAEDDSFGGSMMADAFTSELGQALSRAGGAGLTEFLMGALTRLEPAAVSEAAPSEAASIGTAPTPAVFPGGDGLVSSAFGWRQDPLNGHPRFHAGTDLRVAYGQEVRSAAGGRVTHAGEQGGYGLTVVVDHGGGIETRYAHLSAVEVAPGAAVEAGQPIARSGNSGRSTGAHLHFEVRHNGQPIDPTMVTGLLTASGVAGD